MSTCVRNISKVIAIVKTKGETVSCFLLLLSYSLLFLFVLSFSFGTGSLELLWELIDR